jgi:hypothetical protein
VGLSSCRRDCPPDGGRACASSSDSPVSQPVYSGRSGRGTGRFTSVRRPPRNGATIGSEAPHLPGSSSGPAWRESIGSVCSTRPVRASSTGADTKPSPASAKEVRGDVCRSGHLDRRGGRLLRALHLRDQQGRPSLQGALAATCACVDEPLRPLKAPGGAGGPSLPPGGSDGRRGSWTLRS